MRLLSLLLLSLLLLLLLLLLLYWRAYWIQTILDTIEANITDVQGENGKQAAEIWGFKLFVQVIRISSFFSALECALVRGRTYAKKLRFLRKKGAGYANLKMPCVYSTQKNSDLTHQNAFSLFVFCTQQRRFVEHLPWV